jgi:hypothetical protein
MAEGTGAAIKGVDNQSYGMLCDILEITAFGDTYKKRMAGLKDSSFTISGNVYTGDTTGQDVLIPGNAVMIGAHPSGKAVAATQIPAIVESFEVSVDVAGKQTFSCTLAANGAPVAMPAHT